MTFYLSDSMRGNRQWRWHKNTTCQTFNVRIGILLLFAHRDYRMTKLDRRYSGLMSSVVSVAAVIVSVSSLSRRVAAYIRFGDMLIFHVWRR